MTRREQLIEEAARLRRLQATRRGDLAWAQLTTGLAENEIARRQYDIEELGEQAKALEREATAFPEDRSELPELSLALARQRSVLASRASELHHRSERCHRLAARETALGAPERAGRLEAEAVRLEADASQLELEADRLPAALMVVPRDTPELAGRTDRRREDATPWPGPDRRRVLAAMPPWWLAASPG